MWETQHNCRLGFFQDSDLCKRHGRLEVDNRRNSEHFRKSHVRTNKLMCKKQSSVSHSSTEAEVISLDAGLRMDGIPALDLSDSVVEVVHSSPNQTNKTKDVRESR